MRGGHDVETQGRTTMSTPRGSPKGDPGPGRPQWLDHLVDEFSAVLLGSPLNILLLLVPVTVVLDAFTDAPSGLTFVLAIFGLVPLCERLGFVTEQLALHTNETIGGVLNAVGGNAGALIVSIIALNQDLVYVVQTSLLGSILSNLLFVLGSSLLAGGFMHNVQHFKQAGITVNSSLLVMAGLGLMLPTSLDWTNPPGSPTPDEMIFSRAISIIMLAMYFMYLAFQIITHRHLYEEEEEEEDSSQKSSEDSRVRAAKFDRQLDNASLQVALAQAGLRPVRSTMMDAHSRYPSSYPSPGMSPGMITPPSAASSAGDMEEYIELTLPSALAWFAVIIFLVGVMSDILVSTLAGASADLHIPVTFSAAVLFPIISNAGEHAGAVLFAMRNRLDVTMGICVGSATQVSVLVVPLTVLIAWIMGKDLALDYGGFEVTTLMLAIFLAVTVLQDGSGNWLKGAIMLASYVFFIIGFWLMSNPGIDAEISAASPKVVGE